MHVTIAFVQAVGLQALRVASAAQAKFVISASKCVGLALSRLPVLFSGGNAESSAKCWGQTAHFPSDVTGSSSVPLQLVARTGITAASSSEALCAIAPVCKINRMKINLPSLSRRRKALDQLRCQSIEQKWIRQCGPLAADSPFDRCNMGLSRRVGYLFGVFFP